MSDNPQTNLSSPKRRPTKLILAAALIGIIVLAAVAAYALSNSAPQNNVPSPAPTPTPSISPQTTGQENPGSASPTSPGSSATPAATQSPNPLAWMVKGAYATYEGNTSMYGFDMTFTAKLTVVDLNTTHAQIKTEFNASTLFGSYGNETTMWVEKTSTNFQPVGLNVSRTYQTQVTVPKLGTRNCIAYEYISEGMNATYYVDTTVHWPIKMVLTSPPFDGETYTMDIVLTDTNIAGL